MSYNREILREVRKTNALLEAIAKGMDAWKDADVDAHYNRDKEINHKLSVVLDMMMSFMRTFQKPQVSQEQEEDELAEKVNGAAS